MFELFNPANFLQSLLNNKDAVFFVMAFIMPGFICIKFFEILTGSARSQSSGFRIDYLFWSVVNNFLAIVITKIFAITITNDEAIISILYYFLGFVVLPLILTGLFYKLRKTKYFLKYFGYPKEHIWDYAFKLFSTPKYCIITLDNDEKYGGLLINTGIVSEGRLPKEIYLSEQWEIKKTKSGYYVFTGKKIQHTAGIFLSGIKSVEFIEAYPAKNNN